MTDAPQTPPSKRKAGWVGPVVDYAAPVAFVAVLLIRHDFQLATWFLVAGSALGLLVGLVFERRLAPMPLVAGGAALVFGGLTLVLHDSSFVKMKLTFVDTALAALLLGGLAMGKNPLKAVLGEALKLPDKAWKNLTVRYAVFFLVCAVANEVVRRTQSDERWGVFRLVLLGAALLFSLAQTPFLMKHMITDDAEATPPPPDPGF